MLFLLIFSGYWIVFWQQYIVLPIYIHGYIDPHADVELILITDAVAVICLQFLVTYLTQKIPAFRAITIGTLISALGWLIVASHPAVWAVVLSIFVVALGEIVLSPRYYEYVSRLAPPASKERTWASRSCPSESDRWPEDGSAAGSCITTAKSCGAPRKSGGPSPELGLARRC